MLFAPSWASPAQHPSSETMADSGDKPARMEALKQALVEKLSKLEGLHWARHDGFALLAEVLACPTIRPSLRAVLPAAAAAELPTKAKRFEAPPPPALDAVRELATEKDGDVVFELYEAADDMPWIKLAAFGKDGGAGNTEHFFLSPS